MKERRWINMVAPKFDIDEKKEKYWFKRPESYIFKAKRGLNKEIVAEISWMKEETGMDDQIPPQSARYIP